MNFSSPDDMFTHSETQTKLTSILQIYSPINVEITLSQFVIYLNW